jgi:hypothetical protein
MIRPLSPADVRYAYAYRTQLEHLVTSGMAQKKNIAPINCDVRLPPKADIAGRDRHVR